MRRQVKYEKIPILGVARRCGLVINDRTREHAEIEAKCPFCGDKPRSYHLRMNADSDQFKCWLCGETGNSVSLYAKLEGITNKEAADRLLDKNDDNNVIPFPVMPQTKIAPPRPVKPLGQRHEVYSAMLDHLLLSDAHRENLRERGLSDERIEHNQYRSMPAGESSRLLLSSMLENFHDLDGIPGFYEDKRGRWTIAGASGILVPYRNCDGLIQGLQIRCDNEQERKYRWLASTNYKRGTKSGTHIHITGNLDSDTLYITEGGLKGDVASFLDDDALFVCIAGVSAIEGLIDAVSLLNPRNAIIAMDMDKLANPQVRDAVTTIARQLRRLRGVNIRVANWDARFNGIDNYYYARNTTSTMPLQFMAA